LAANGRQEALMRGLSGASRFSPFSLGVALIVITMATAVIGAGSSIAQVTVWSNKWCIMTRAGMVVDCSFKSLDQCHQTTSGTRSECYPNVFYPVRPDPAEAKPSSRKTKSGKPNPGKPKQ
jgi:hypothetical protein